MSCSSVSQLLTFDCPQPDQVELVLIGPRYGESICIHIGDGRWMAIDSCLYGAKSTAAPLYYLEKIGAEPESIEIIAATHWHDDHVRGLSAVVEASPSARFCLPSALSTREFLTLASAYSGTALSKGVRELHKILLQIDPARLAFCGPSTLILRTSTSAGDIEIHALSPSSDEYRASLLAFAALRPSDGEPHNDTPSRGPNHLAMVISLRINGVEMLLGADLEENGNPLQGWSAVLGQQATGTNGTLFKVPHHGSQTAYCPGVWTQMLANSPVAVMTPFHHGRSKLPTDPEVRRLKSHTPYVFLTTPQPLVRSQRKSSMVEDEIDLRTNGQGMFHERSEPGIVRCRMRPSEDWTVHLHGTAAQL